MMDTFSLTDTSIQTRIQALEDEFFDSVASGEEALQDFSDRWAGFAEEMTCLSLSPATAQQVDRVSTTIDILCRSLISLEETAQEIQESLEAQIDTILDSTKPLSSPSSMSSSRRDISLAAAWMAQNYHDPYPSVTVRDEISRGTNWNRKDLDNWFTEARKRIGWSTIRRQFFDNKQAEAVKASSDFFLNGGLLTPALESAFAAMAARVQELYVEPFRSSNLAIGRSKAGVTAPFYRPYPDEGSPSRPSNTPSRSYPARPLSPISRSASPGQLRRKRPRSVIEDEFQSEKESQRKRPRCDGFVPVTLSQLQLPSPAASQSDLSQSSPPPTANDPLDSKTPPRRKRSLTPLPNPECRRAQPELHGPQNHTSSGIRATGLQAASASLSVPASPVPGAPTPAPIDEFQVQLPQFSYEFPGPASCDQLTHLQTVNLELFSSADLPNDRPTSSTLNNPSLDLFASSSLLDNTSPQTMPLATDFDISSLSNLFSTPLCEDQLLGLPFDPSTFADPAAHADTIVDSARVDISLNSLLALDPQVIEPQADNVFFCDLLYDFSTPSATDSEKVRFMTHIEMLKQQKDRIQERICLLEKRICSTI